MTIGLTGGSGTGKSTACLFFKSKGYLIIDADRVYGELCLAGSRCLDEIADFFGEDVLTEDKNLNRQYLAKIVFSDSGKLKKLNQITHKYVKKEIEDTIEKNKGKNIVIDAPLLIEAGLDKICDVTVCILADKEKRIDRITKRDGKTYDEAKKRIESQHNDEFYLEKCDIAIYNNADTDTMLSALEGELKEYV